MLRATRRAILRGAAAAGVATQARALPRGTGGSAPSSGLAAQIVVPSGAFAGTFNFAVAGGSGQTVTTQQPYVDPGLSGVVSSQFTEQRTRVTNSGLANFAVIFCVDTAGTQNCHQVICEYQGGLATSGAVDLAAGYAITVTNNGSTVYSATLAAHPWDNRWRVCSQNGGAWAVGNPRPVTRSIAQLTTANLIPAYDPTNLTGADTPVPPPQTYSAPLAIPSAMAVNMTNTGDRTEIGFLHNWSAHTIVTGIDIASTFQVAESFGSWNTIIRDPSTLAPPDLISTYPQASIVSGTPLIMQTSYKVPYGTGTPCVYDSGHSPNFSYLAFLMTGDPYYLENLQFQMNRDLLNVGHGFRFTEDGRYLAWPLRTCLMAVVATPATPPNWLLNNTQVTSVLTAYGTSIALFAGGASSSDIWTGINVYTTTNIDPGANFTAFWENEYLAIVVTWAYGLNANSIISVPAGIISLANGAINSCQQRTNGTSGWNNSYPDIYDCPLAAITTVGSNVNIGDTTITVSNLVTDAFANGVSGGFYISTATTASCFTYPTPFQIYYTKNGHVFTVTNITGNVWTLSTPSTIAITASTTAILYGTNFTTWTSQWTFQANAGGFNAPPGNVAGNGLLPSSYTYYNITRAAQSMGKQAGIAAADPTYMNAVCAYSALANPNTSACDYKWMIAG
jgi:hypothetical protein